jgi:N-methylhydantoinase A/oxoprolinase/acetone carboxylase beta subunit/N-methylhydantoinase B/oxoprolinase/acetone carboxylase alpha subunit
MTGAAVDPPFRIGVDVGGTFTDAVLVGASGGVRAFKVASEPTDPARSVLRALSLAGEGVGFDLAGLLHRCSVLVHGSTIAVNTILERKGARVGLLATAGFHDSLEIRRGIRRDVWNYREPDPEVLVPRFLRRPVRGRLDAEGAELAALAEEDIIAAVEIFRREEVDSVAVCFLHSYRNPAHEYLARDILSRLWPEAPVSCSADVVPILGEYERSSTTVLNAYVAPRVVPYLKTLHRELQSLGLPSELLLMQSNGGAISVNEIADRPIHLALSGPAAGVGALAYFSEDAGTENLISIEIGGTSCDVTLASRGEVAMADRIAIDEYHISLPAVQIHTVGAGGGTIARVDNAGLLHAGPEGAGAKPGPAAYGFGGDRPTVTDAQLALGRLKPGPHAGGAIDLDLDRAHTAIEHHVARPLGLDVETAAAGIIRLVEQHVLNAVERVSVERGHDPREFIVVAAGGAGPMHATAVARALGCAGVYVPRLAGVFCAFGMCNTDLRHDYQRPWLAELEPSLADVWLRAAFDRLVESGRAILAREGFVGTSVAFDQRMDLRYTGQQWTIDVATPNLDARAIRSAFEIEHNRLYGYLQATGRIEIVNIRVAATGRMPPTPSFVTPRAFRPPAPVGSRRVWLAERESAVDMFVFDGAALRFGHAIAGPAVVDEATTTILVGAGEQLTVTAGGNYLIRFTGAPAAPAHTVDVAETARRSMPVNRFPRPPLSDDPVLLAVVQKQLDHLTYQMGDAMMRSARSPVFSESHDFSCFLATPAGDVVAQADGLPIHSGSGAFAVRGIIKAFSGRIARGDVFLSSDPYVAGGNHLPDWTVVRPVFVGDRLAAFACNRAHQSDIGGGAAGTYNPAATEIFHEGIRLPALKLVDGGVLRDDLFQLLLINCRTPDLLEGDLGAMLGSVKIGAERLAGILANLGPERGKAILAALLDHGERRLRREIAQLPEGSWHGEDSSDTDCFETVEVPIRVKLTIAKSGMTFDFTGSSPQIRGFKNSSLANTCSCVYVATATFFDHTIPRNSGTFRAVEVIAPAGTVVNALPPAPMTMNTVFPAIDIIHACWKALAQVDRERACAGAGKSVFGVSSGTRPDGRTFVMYHWHSLAGGGALKGRDGFPQSGHLPSLGGLTLPNVEAYERIYPCRIYRQELRRDSAGAGEYRGGASVDYEAELFVPTQHAVRNEGLNRPTGYGINGGLPGAKGSMIVQEEGREPVPAPQYGITRLAPFRVTIEGPAGGGWGDPRRRDPERVLRDVRDGVVSPAVARETYRVGVTAGSDAVDQAETARLREKALS